MNLPARAATVKLSINDCKDSAVRVFTNADSISALAVRHGVRGQLD